MVGLFANIIWPYAFASLVRTAFEFTKAQHSLKRILAFVTKILCVCLMMTFHTYFFIHLYLKKIRVHYKNPFLAFIQHHNSATEGPRDHTLHLVRCRIFDCVKHPRFIIHSPFMFFMHADFGSRTYHLKYVLFS